MLCGKVWQGGVFNQSKKLHKIESIVLSDLHAGRSGEHSRDEQEWCAEVGHQFCSKWGTRRLQDRVNLLDAVLPYDSVGIEVFPERLLGLLTKSNAKRSWTIMVCQLGLLSFSHMRSQRL